MNLPADLEILDDTIDEREYAEIMEAPLAPAESQTPWKHTDAGIGCRTIRSATNGYIGCITSYELAERICAAVNKE